MSNFKTSIGKNLKPYTKYIPEIDKQTMRTLVKLCVAFIENRKYSKEVFDKEILRISTLNQDGPKNYDIYCTIVMILLETFLKSRKSENISDVLRELKFQSDCVDDLTKVLVSNHQSLLEQFQEMKLLKPLRKFEYRINISLVESGQQPTIILHLKHNEEMKTVNLSLKQFHRLRLAIASALAELQAIESRN